MIKNIKLRPSAYYVFYVMEENNGSYKLKVWEIYKTNM